MAAMHPGVVSDSAPAFIVLTDEAQQAMALEFQVDNQDGFLGLPRFDDGSGQYVELVDPPLPI